MADESLAEQLLIFCSYVVFVIFLPVTLFFCFITVAEYEKVIIFRLGRLLTTRPLGPGLVFILPCVDTYEIIDLRIFTIDIEPQEILSKDSITITVDAVIYYHIFNPLLAILEIHNYSYSTAMLGATILRNILGTRNLKDILTDRKMLSEDIQKILEKATDPWGVKIQRVEIQEVKLPPQMQRAMATEAEASREARAKVIAADAELKSSRKLKEASDVIVQGAAALQLRYLQTLNALSAEKRSTIFFPIPMNLMPNKETE